MVLAEGVDNDVADKEVDEVFNSQDLGGDALGLSGLEEYGGLTKRKEGHKL